MKCRKLLYMIALLLVLMLFSSCKKYEGPYIFFRQEHENIDRIEICSYNWKTDTKTVVATLTEAEANHMALDLAALNCKQYYPGDHSRTYGSFIVCIIYSDCEQEWIGPYNIGFVTSDGVKGLTNYYPASEAELWNLVVKHTDENALTQLKRTE